MLAPTDEMLRAYKMAKGAWDVDAERFLALMAERRIDEKLRPASLHGACLLCSEPTEHYCHRRLVVEYLTRKWGGALAVRHL